MPSRNLDFLIVGQGLSGSALAWHLIKAGQRVLVIDNGHRSAASRVAAGLINPLAGMRFNRRPEVSDWLRSAESWYGTLEHAFAQRLLHPRPMLRLFRSPEQQRFYQRRRDDPEATHLLGGVFTSQDCPEPISAPYGGFVQHRTGHVDLPLLLALSREWLCAKDSLTTQEFDAAALEASETGVSFGTWRARHAVFCEGHRLLNNPWFDDLPLQPVKGEILTLQTEAWQPQNIVNGAHWLLPQQHGLIRFGATHGHQDVSPLVTEQARQTLLDGLRSIAPTHRFKLVDHQAGFRPATPDRYPFLGRSRRHPAVWVCNGFGARGALSIPWYTTRLASHLVEQRPLPAEADIARLRNQPRDPA